MPRLPTIRVMGSQAISVSWPVSWPVFSPLVVVIARSPRLLVAGEKLAALGPPLGLLVRGAGGEAAEGADHGAVHAAGGGRYPRAGRLVHERHELVGEPRHRARDADAADVGAAADAVDPAALGHVALDDRSP